jgi:hypothetical protein
MKKGFSFEKATCKNLPHGCSKEQKKEFMKGSFFSELFSNE